MARRRKYAFITSPELKASVVVESFVNKAKLNVDKWAGAYKSNIGAYTADEGRQTFAAVKLAGFYQGLSDPDVKSAIRDAITKAKAKKDEVVGAVLGKVPVPAVPEEAKRTAKKVAEILGVAIPGLAPAPAPRV